VILTAFGLAFSDKVPPEFFRALADNKQDAQEAHQDYLAKRNAAAAKQIAPA